MKLEIILILLAAFVFTITCETISSEPFCFLERRERERFVYELVKIFVYLVLLAFAVVVVKVLLLPVR